MDDTAIQTAPNTVQLERLLDAPIERVWEFLVDPVKRGLWFAAGPLEQKQGGALAFTFDHDNLSANDVPYPEKYLKTKGHGRRRPCLRIRPAARDRLQLGQGRR